MRYPLSVVQVLLRAFFGCGVVCGMDIRAATPPQPEQRDAAGKLISRPAECDADYGLIIDKGVALGCDGYPIELCGPLKLDLTPDPCRIDRGSKQMFVAIRRVTAAEAAARPCGCSSGGDPAGQQCTRMRDHILVQAFDGEHLPKDLCRVPEAKDVDGAAPKTSTGTAAAAGAQPQGAATSICDCLKQCGECACCGDPWVLLGTVMVTDKGLEAIAQDGYRRYVKPVACICGAPSNQPQTSDTTKPRAEAQTVSAPEQQPKIEPQTAPQVTVTPVPDGQAAADPALAKAGETQPTTEPVTTPAGTAQPGTAT